MASKSSSGFNPTGRTERGDRTEVQKQQSGSQGVRDIRQMVDIMKESTRQESLNQRICNIESAQRKSPSALTTKEWENYRRGLEKLKHLPPGTEEHIKIEQKLFEYDIKTYPVMDIISRSSSSDSTSSNDTLNKEENDYRAFMLKNLSRSTINSWVGHRDRDSIYTDDFMNKAQVYATKLQEFKNSRTAIPDAITLDALKNFEALIDKQVDSLTDEQLNSNNAILLTNTTFDFSDIRESFEKLQQGSSSSDSQRQKDQFGSDEEVKNINQWDIQFALKKEKTTNEAIIGEFEKIITLEGEERLNAWRELGKTSNIETIKIMKEVILFARAEG